MDAIVLGNWKLHGSVTHLRQFVQQFATLRSNSATPIALTNMSVGLCLPAVYLAEAQVLLAASSTMCIGAQDVSEHASGAYTGEVAAAMLAEFACGYTLLGHSERRQYHGETDAQVAVKARQLLTHNIIPVCCVGENLQQRQAGEAQATVLKQLRYLLADDQVAASMIIAYEPIWAIGTGQTASPEQAQRMHQFIRHTTQRQGIDCAIVYGGSVNVSNAKALSEMPDVNGFLVGGASLEASSFYQICEVFS